MAGFLSLPDELIERVGEQVIRSYDIGLSLRAWCRVTCTCKRLWEMQLPGSAVGWDMKLYNVSEGESKVLSMWLAQRRSAMPVPLMMRWYEQVPHG